MPVDDLPIRVTTAARGALVAGCGLLALSASVAAQDGRPSDETLLALQASGRQIALYLEAVDRAADLMKRQGGGAAPTGRTLVIQDREGWRVLYLEDATNSGASVGAVRKGLAVVAETTFSPDAGAVGTLGLIVPPKAAAATVQSYAHALAMAEEAILGRPDGGAPLEDTVVKEKDGTYTVYVISQHQEEGAAPAGDGPQGSVLFGRDFVVRISVGARQILSTDRLHESLASLSLKPRPPGTPLLHEHDKGDLPSPTDVAQVLRHRVLAPLLVLTQRFMFRIDQEGSITWLGANPNPKPPAGPAPGALPRRDPGGS